MKSKYKIGQKVWFIANQFSVVEGTVKMTYTIGGGTKYLIACQRDQTQRFTQQVGS